MMSLRMGDQDAPVTDGNLARYLPQTHMGAMPNSSSKPNAKFMWVDYDELQMMVVVQAGERGIACGEDITANYHHGDFPPADPPAAPPVDPPAAPPVHRECGLRLGQVQELGSREAAHRHSAREAIALTLPKFIRVQPLGARILHLNYFIIARINMTALNMTSPTLLLEAGLRYLIEHHRGDLQVLHVRGLQPTEGIVESICTLIRGGTLWGINAGEWYFSKQSMLLFLEAARSPDSKLCFAFFEANHCGKQLCKEMRRVMYTRRVETVSAPWVFGQDTVMDAAVREDNKFWKNPSRLRRNQIGTVGGSGTVGSDRDSSSDHDSSDHDDDDAVGNEAASLPVLGKRRHCEHVGRR